MEIQDFVRDASGARVGRPNRLFGEKKPFVSKELSEALRAQWQVAGRDNARVLMRLTEANGANPHYVTGWDGDDRYVCYTETGLTYISSRRLQRLTLDETWEPKTLIHVREPILRENNTRGDVDTLMSRVRKPPVDQRPHNKLVEAVGKKEKAAKTPYKAADAVGALQPAPEHPVGAPEDPPGRDKYEAFTWNVVDEQGRPKRRALKHKKMDCQLDKRELVHMRTESVGRCAVCYTTRVLEAEDKGCGECGARELVDIRSEGGKQKGNGGKDGNQTDPQLDKRELVDLRAEALGSTCPKCKVKDCGMESHKGYWGEKVATPEEPARQKVDVRTESKMAYGHPGSTCQGFHPGKSHDEWLKQMHTLTGVGHKMEAFKGKFPAKSPDAAKKPLFVMMLMRKGKPGKVEEAAKPSYKLLQRPDEETDRQEVDTDIGEALERDRSFRIAENDEWHKLHSHKFLANMQRMKAGLMKRKKKIQAPSGAFQSASTSYPAAH